MKCSGAMPPQCPIRRVGRDFEPLLWVIAGIALCLAVLAVNRTLAVEGKVSAIIVDSLEIAAYHASSALEHEARGTDPYHRAYLAENTCMLAQLMRLAAGPNLSPAAERGLERYGSWLGNEDVSARARLQVARNLWTTLRQAQVYVPRSGLRTAVRRRLQEMLEGYQPSEEPGA